MDNIQHARGEPGTFAKPWYSLVEFFESPLDAYSAIIIAAPGSRSEGFTISVFPVTIAIGIVQRGIILTGRHLSNGKDTSDRKLTQGN